MLALFFASWVDLGASWLLLALAAAFVVALGWFLCVLDRFGFDFGGFWEVPGMVLKTPGLDFLRFFRDCELSMRPNS